MSSTIRSGASEAPLARLPVRRVRPGSVSYARLSESFKNGCSSARAPQEEPRARRPPEAAER